VEIQIQKLSQPVKFIVTESADVVKEMKLKTFNKLKNELPAIDGFRKGNIPRDVAERKFGVEKLYKSVLDDIHAEVASLHNIISSRNFKIFGDFSDKSPLKIEFIAEVEPIVNLVDYNDVNVKYEKDLKVTEDEINEVIQGALKQNEKFESVERDDLQDLDTVIIDFEGTLEGESEPFKNGSAKNFKLEVNTQKKTFIDNFEEQMIGMKKGEGKDINVCFPESYGDKTKAGKKAIFKVILHDIKKSVLPELNEEFIKKMGSETFEGYKKTIENNLLINKRTANDDQLKKSIIREFVEKSKFEPIPIDMIENEIDREWRSHLSRMGKSEEDMIKENRDSKEYFRIDHYDQAESLIKMTLILKALAKKEEINVSKEEVETYTLNISKALKYSDEKKKRILKELERPEMYSLQEKAATNEKVVEFLISKYRN